MAVPASREQAVALSCTVTDTKVLPCPMQLRVRRGALGKCHGGWEQRSKRRWLHGSACNGRCTQRQPASCLSSSVGDHLAACMQPASSETPACLSLCGLSSAGDLHSPHPGPRAAAGRAGSRGVPCRGAGLPQRTGAAGPQPIARHRTNLTHHALNLLPLFALLTAHCRCGSSSWTAWPPTPATAPPPRRLWSGCAPCPTRRAQPQQAQQAATSAAGWGGGAAAPCHHLEQGPAAQQTSWPRWVQQQQGSLRRRRRGLLRWHLLACLAAGCHRRGVHRRATPLCGPSRGRLALQPTWPRRSPFPPPMPAQHRALDWPWPHSG